MSGMRRCGAHYQRSAVAKARLLMLQVCFEVGIAMVLWDTVVGGDWNTTFIFPYNANSNPNWLMFFRWVETTKQLRILWSLRIAKGCLAEAQSARAKLWLGLNEKKINYWPLQQFVLLPSNMVLWMGLLQYPAQKLHRLYLPDWQIHVWIFRWLCLKLGYIPYIYIPLSLETNGLK